MVCGSHSQAKDAKEAKLIEKERIADHKKAKKKAKVKDAKEAKMIEKERKKAEKEAKVSPEKVAATQHHTRHTRVAGRGRTAASQRMRRAAGSFRTQKKNMPKDEKSKAGATVARSRSRSPKPPPPPASTAEVAHWGAGGEEKWLGPFFTNAGVVALIGTTPFLAVIIWDLLVNKNGSIVTLMKVIGEESFTGYFLEMLPWPTQAAVMHLVCYATFEGLLQVYLPGKVHHGPITANGPPR